MRTFTFFQLLTFLLVAYSCPAVTLSVSPVSQAVPSGQNLNVDVQVAGFANIVAFQFSMEWDPAVLQFQSVTPALPGLAPSNFNTGITNTGRLSVAFAVTSGSFSLPDGSNLFSIQFLAVGAGGATSAIQFNHTPTPMAVYDNTLQALPISTQPGQVNISGTTGGVHLSAAGVTSCGGEPVCIPVSVAGFQQIASAQFSMSWDPALFSFQQVQQVGLPGMTPGNFGTSFTGSGVLSFAWVHTPAVSVPDGTVLFEVCLTPVGPGGSASPFNFTNTPTGIEFIDQSFNAVPYLLTNGSLSMSPSFSILVCNDLIEVNADTNCQALVTVDALIEGICPGYSTIFIRENSSGPVLFSGAGQVSFDATAYIGQTLYYQVTESGSGNSCWGNIRITGNCGGPAPTLCDSISAYVPDTAQCCKVLVIQNQKPDFFSGVVVSVLSGGTLAGATAHYGWSLQNPGASTAWFIPMSGGTIGTGAFEVGHFCIDNISAAEQTLVLDFYDSAGQIVCSDTFSMHCTACVQTTVSAVRCKSPGVYEMDFCVKAGEALDWPVGTVQIVPPPGVTFTPGLFCPVNIYPGNTSCSFTTTVSGAGLSAGDPVCFTTIVHKENLCAGEPDLHCCSSPEPVCFEVPECDPCLFTYATAEQVVHDGDSCCWNITLHGQPDFFTGVETALAPGWSFDVIANYPGSGWAINTTFPYSTANVGWTPIPPLGSTVPDGVTLPTVCFANDGAGATPAEMVVTWLSPDGMNCSDTLSFDCPGDAAACVTVSNTSIVCTGSGSYTYTFTVTNQSHSPAFDADQVEILPVAGPANIAPLVFGGFIPAGGSATYTATVTGNPGDPLCFNLVLHDIADDSLHLNCCPLADTVCVTLPPCDTCELICIYNTNLAIAPPICSATIYPQTILEQSCPGVVMTVFEHLGATLAVHVPSFTVQANSAPLLWVHAVNLATGDSCWGYVTVTVDPGCLPAPLAYDFQLFPNPASSTLQLIFDAPLPATAAVRLLDMTGRVRMRPADLPAGTQQTQLDVSGLAPGLYVADVQVSGWVALRRRFVVQWSEAAER